MSGTIIILLENERHVSYLDQSATDESGIVRSMGKSKNVNSIEADQTTIQQVS